MSAVFSRRPWGRNECVTNEPERTSAERLWYRRHNIKRRSVMCSSLSKKVLSVIHHVNFSLDLIHKKKGRKKEKKRKKKRTWPIYSHLSLTSLVTSNAYNLAGFLITLSPNRPFASNSKFFSAKVPITKTKSATIAFFSFSSFPSPHSFFFSFLFPSLLLFWSFSGVRNLPFDAFSHKWLQISFGWFSKNQLDIYLFDKLFLTNHSLLIETCYCLKWNFEKNTNLQYID